MLNFPITFSWHEKFSSFRFSANGAELYTAFDGLRCCLDSRIDPSRTSCAFIEMKLTLYTFALFNLKQWDQREMLKSKPKGVQLRLGMDPPSVENWLGGHSGLDLLQLPFIYILCVSLIIFFCKEAPKGWQNSCNSI